jgi:hypothetical protein
MKKRRTRTKERDALAASMQEIRQRIDTVNRLFDTADNDLLLDACIYELKYLRLRYAYLMQLARDAALHAEEIQPQQTVILAPVES